MKKILIIDDDQVSRKMILKIIEDIGHAGVQASNGKVALDILRDNDDIGLAIADMVMPGLDGRGLIEELRSQKWPGELPVVLISGIMGPNEISDLLNNGASRFLSKPIDPRELQQCVQDLLKENRGDF